MDVFLETERLILRWLTADDADNLVELDGDPDVMRYITGGRSTSREKIETRILPWFMHYREQDSGYGFWAAIEKATDKFIGWFHLRPEPDDPPDEPELGYRLRKEVWGKGYATEGSKALIDKAFRDLGASRIYAETMAVNTASRRVMEKAGLEFEATFHADWPVRIEGDEKGDVRYALRREVWARRGGMEP